MEKIAAAGYDPHLHTVGEGAVSIVLDAIEKCVLLTQKRYSPRTRSQ